MSEWQTPRLAAPRARSPIMGRQVLPACPVAAVGPTPQTETGALSPLPVTPRVPLAELDRSSLSTRLFHSPSLPAASPSPCQANRKDLQRFLGLNNDHEMAIGSPSDMLMTQSQVSVSPSDRSRAGRRDQLTTESQLLELHTQVQQLGTMLRKQRSNPGPTEACRHQVEQLTRERALLQEQLDARDDQVDMFKTSLARLHSEYMAGLAEMKEEAARLTDTVAERTAESQAMARQQEEAAARHLALEREHEKSLKTIQGLRSYIAGLPAREEVVELRARAEAQAGATAQAETRAAELTSQLEEARTELREVRQGRAELEAANAELIGRNGELTETVNEAERIRLEARGCGEDDLELLVYDKNELQKDNEVLRRALEVRSREAGEERDRLEEQAARVGGLLAQATEELQTAVTDLRLAQGRCQRLESHLRQKKAEAASLTERLGESCSQSSSLEAAAAAGGRLQPLYSRLARSMGRCLQELTGLQDLCSQVMNGGNPNVSVLLGVREVELPGEATVMHRDMADLTMEERLEVVRAQLAEVQRVQGQVRELRTQIADRYAESLADNMTSCVTQ